MKINRSSLLSGAALVAAISLPTVAFAADGDPVDPAAKIAEMGAGALLLVGAIVAAIVVVGLSVLGIKGLTTAFKAIGRAMSSGT